MSNSPQGIHTLPVELLDLVFQSLWDGKRSVFAFSRVSRLWREVARPHLFASLRITFRFDFVDFDAFLRAHANIAQHLRKLQLKHVVTLWMRNGKLADRFSGVGRAQLRDLVASLPHLRELHLYRLCAMSLPNTAPDAPNPLPTHKLEKLTIDHCDALDTNFTLATLLNIVSLFASIDTLELVSLRLSTAPHDFARVIHTVSVGALVITDVFLPPQFEAGSLYHLLRKSLAPSCLRSLEIECLRSKQPELWPGNRVTDRVAREPRGLRSFGQLVEIAACYARHISLPFRVSSPVELGEDDPGAQLMLRRSVTRHVPTDVPTEHWRVLNLHACTSLTSLTLEVTVPPTHSLESPWDIPHVPLADVCIALLANIPATVQVLIIKLSGANERAAVCSARTLGLGALDAALAERYGHLERVQVTLGTVTSTVVDCLDAVTKAMPKLRTRGMLTVSPAR